MLDDLRASISTRRDSIVASMSWDKMKNVLGSSDAGGAFQNANEARFARTVLSEDHGHSRGEIDLRARLERIDAVAYRERVEADGFEWIPGELLFLNFWNGLERIFREL